MSDFDILMQARHETEFFVILCNVVEKYFGPYRPGKRHKSHIIRAELNGTGSHQNGYALSFEIEQSFSVPNEKGGFSFTSQTTHVFTLHQDGKLTWWMMGQPTLTGLKDIQVSLKRLRETVEPILLPEAT